MTEEQQEMERLRQSEFRARGKIASFCDGASKLIHRIDELPKDADPEKVRAILNDTGKKLRVAVMLATE